MTGVQLVAELLSLLQPKQETRKGGVFEDVKRPNLQTTMHGALRFLQILLVFAAVYCWSKVAEAYQPESVTGRFADIASVTLWLLTLSAVGLAYVKLSARLDADRAWTIIIIAALLVVWFLFNWFIAPVIVFTLIEIEHNLLYLIPILVTAAAAAFVPSAEIGRYSFRRELTEQNTANSEKSVVDVTAIQIERMKIAEARRKDDIEKAKLREEIARLTDMLRKPQAQTAGIIDPEPTFTGGKRIEDCIRAVKVNGHYEYQALARDKPRRLDATLLLNFVIEAWGRNRFERKYWMERGLKRDDWEAMCNAIDFGRNQDGEVIRGVDDVISDLMRYGVITPSVYPPAPLENSLSPSRPIGTAAGTPDNSPESGVGG